MPPAGPAAVCVPGGGGRNGASGHHPAIAAPGRPGGLNAYSAVSRARGNRTATSGTLGGVCMSLDGPILVTGAAGSNGGVGRTVVELLRQRNLPVRALVRRDDARAEALRATGAEVVVGDLTQAGDVVRALAGCRRLYFGLSVSPPYLEATVIAAAVARAQGDLEVFVNISQMTVSQMSLTAMTDSAQQRQLWLSEQVLNWSRLPVVHVRTTVFLQ